MSWTNERIELLQKLWLEGWSASRIAGELAHGISRNAVIGKVYRLGLSGRAKALPGNVPASPPHQKAPRRAAHQHANSPQVVGNTALALHPFVIEVAAFQTVRDVRGSDIRTRHHFGIARVDVPLADRRSGTV
jgi:GcrA cell cycle regulator